MAARMDAAPGQGRPIEGLVTVMGLGRFGGGAGVSRWLCRRGASVLLTDVADETSLEGPLATLSDLITTGKPEAGRIALRLGGHRAEDFSGASLVVANVAVPRPESNPFLGAARSAGVPIVTEIRLAVEELGRLGITRIAGITGSAGKSTTSALVRHLLGGAARTSVLGGNFGGSLLGEIDSLDRDAFVTLELSSAMLGWLAAGAGSPSDAGWSPPVAALTNLAVNHVDWHGSLGAYVSAKAQIRRDQGKGDAFVTRFPVESPETSTEIARAAGDWWSAGAITGEPLAFDPADLRLPLPGDHNRRNATLALLVAAECLRRAGETPDVDELAGRLADFRGLPHRLELVLDRNGLRFVNDSKSTVPEATLLAIQAFPDPSRVHLIAGGYDKGSDLSPIRDFAPRLARVYAIGRTADRLLGPNVSDSRELEAAVAEAVGRMREGEVLLLSPGCASWDQFVNFEERGDRFRRLVETLFPARTAGPSPVTARTT
jgi:UDP-N-acetylmuramoylalanine--D-glutamate ligase